MSPLPLPLWYHVADAPPLRDSGRDSLLVKGRMYNVSTRHIVDAVDDFIEAAAKRVVQIHCTVPSPKGDVLVFMPGTSIPSIAPVAHLAPDTEHA